MTYLFIWELFMHNGTGKVSPSSMYPIKYLNEPFLPYESLPYENFFLIFMQYKEEK